jgi:hypothetical protein
MKAAKILAFIIQMSNSILKFRYIYFTLSIEIIFKMPYIICKENMLNDGANNPKNS